MDFFQLLQLGPPLFSIFKNHLQSSDTNSSLDVKYADDQTWSFFVPQGLPDIAPPELLRSSKWHAENAMVLNSDKPMEIVSSNLCEGKTNFPPVDTNGTMIK